MTNNRRTKPMVVVGAFTLIETVFVVSLIALLAAITIGVGASMMDSGRKRATEGVLQVLDQSLADYIAATGSIPSALVGITLEEDFGGKVRGDTVYFPAVDGVLNLPIVSVDPDDPLRHQKINSIGLYLASVQGAIDIDGLLSSVDSSFVKNYDAPGDLQPSMLTVFDAWGNPIRYVHPKFDGIIEDSTDLNDRRELGEPGDFLSVCSSADGFFTAGLLVPDDSFILFVAPPVNGEVRRNKIIQLDHETARASGSLDYPVESDSDGGRCPSQRPYFYSAGPDGDPATIDDNVYTVVPSFTSPF